MIKENRSADMERDNKITVIINSKDSEDAKDLYILLYYPVKRAFGFVVLSPL